MAITKKQLEMKNEELEKEIKRLREYAPTLEVQAERDDLYKQINALNENTVIQSMNDMRDEYLRIERQLIDKCTENLRIERQLRDKCTEYLKLEKQLNDTRLRSTNTHNKYLELEVQLNDFKQELKEHRSFLGI